MFRTLLARSAFSFLGFAVLLASGAQAQLEPINNRPNPYTSVDNWVDLPNGRTWGSTAGVDIDPDGRHLWAIGRCGTRTSASRLHSDSPRSGPTPSVAQIMI